MAKGTKVHCIPDVSPYVYFAGPLDFKDPITTARDAANKMTRRGSVVFKGHRALEDRLEVDFEYLVSGPGPNEANNYIMPSFGYRCVIHP